MANPLPNEESLYKRIRDEKIQIHPIVWDLLTHHIGNDLYGITIELQSSVLDNVNPKPLSQASAEKILKRAFNIKDLIHKLKEATGRGAKF